MAKKKRKKKDKFWDETQWCVMYREYWQTDGRWCWDWGTTSNSPSESISSFVVSMAKSKGWWITNRNAGVVACVKVKLVEQ